MLYLVKDIFILQVHAVQVLSVHVWFLAVLLTMGVSVQFLFLVFDFLVEDKWNSSSLIFLDPKGQEHICSPEPP